MEKTDHPPEPRIPPMQWYDRLNALNVSFLVFILAVVFSAKSLRVADPARQINYLENLLRFTGRFFPPDWSVTPQVLLSLVETVQIAVMASAFSILISIPLGVAGAQNLSPRFLVFLTRNLLNLIRTIPGLVWALLAVAVVGANSLAGVIGLTFYSIGYLGKFFSDSFEGVDISVARGLRAIGASRFQAFQYGVWPNAKPIVWSYGLWMLEYNIRSASIIGYVGAGGVGVLLHTYQEFSNWDKFATVLIYILLIVTVLDFIGEKVRRQITVHTQSATQKVAVTE
ncbi:MAG: phosphonate ABC transporter, permease protein PhnE [Verrucomicrobiae bacterium]|nr:phosphonate ABC transporter, permease protein PhnE [Verrucomicrobiae bacterium]